MAVRLEIEIGEKRFGSGPTVLRDLRLSVTPGEIVALLGPSGIGKSTLLRLVAGTDTEFVGTITIDGTPAAQAPPPGFVFQDARLLPWLTARDNVRLADPMMDAATADRHLAAVGLADRALSWPRALSGGMQRRVALARALATNADLLLLDEPFVSLDATLAAEMHALLLRLVEARGPTVLLVSHAPAEAAALADRAIVLGERPAGAARAITMPVARDRRGAGVIADYARAIAGD